jgi:catechol 2,3-dioxygenase-like lactoylglutathione lyase family enzyme
MENTERRYRQYIGAITLLVREYDEAIAFYMDKMGFTLVEDTPLTPEKRWVLVCPPVGETCLLLARAVTPEQVAQIGNQAGGRVFLFLEADHFWADYERMQAAGVTFLEEPREESYGTVAVFVDLYGNKYDLIQRNLM